MEIKIKPLRPAHKEKKRYIAMEVMGNTSKSALIMAMNKALLDYLGELGLAQAGAFPLPETYTKDGIVVRTAHNYVDHVKAAFTMTDGIILQTKGVSGLISKAKALIGG
ncbi:MAG: hypothetical protein KJ709_02490 [Nanoarchaeota archaeon]|nr:hypothetical protein [Nanoarchaeota archaeon]